MKSRFCLSLAVLAFLLSGCMSDGPDTIVLLFPSSSSEAPSSSSEVPSSSSEAPSSSSSVSNCADFDPEAEVEHYGKMKKQICDERDGKKYVYVVIGEQTWMAENLNYEAEGGKCYDNDPANCDTYGRLYTWAAAMALPASCNNSTCSGQIQSPHQGICPDGWHIPSSEDWGRLSRYVDGTTGTFAGYVSSTAGRYLKSTSGWNSNGNGTDEHGFTALPGGFSTSSGGFFSVGSYGVWWSASESDGISDGAYFRDIYYFNDDAGWNSHYKTNLYSVHCLQD
jgi:uncharacterized protein (TIGR02145 family)